MTEITETVPGPVHLEQNLVRTVEVWMQETIVDQFSGEKLAWAVSFQVFPSPTEDNGWVPTLVLYVHLQVTEEDSFYATHLLPPFGLTREPVEAAVVDAVNTLKQRRDVAVESGPSVGESVAPA
jgi:hypothetical protein